MNKDSCFDVTKLHEEFYVNGKYVGGIPAKEDKKRGTGYYSRRVFLLEKDTEVSKGNKKYTIKKGTEVRSEIILLCLRANKKALHAPSANKFYQQL